MSASDDLGNARAHMRVDALEERVDGLERMHGIDREHVATQLARIVSMIERVLQNQDTERDRVDAVERDIVNIRTTRKKK